MITIYNNPNLCTDLLNSVVIIRNADILGINYSISIPIYLRHLEIFCFVSIVWIDIENELCVVLSGAEWFINQRFMIIFAISEISLVTARILNGVYIF